MAWTPVWVATADVREAIEIQSFSGNLPTAVTSRPFTGARSYQISGSLSRWGKTLPASTELRLGYYVNTDGLIGSTSTTLRSMFGRFRNSADTGTIFGVARKASTDEFHLIVNDVEQSAFGTTASLGFNVADVWKHVGMIVRVGNPGYAAFFLDNALITSYTGEITGTVGTFEIESYSSGSSAQTNGWLVNSSYFDDFYIDDITGEPNDAPPAYRFPVRIANAAGEDAAWDSTEANNYQAVDDNPHDGDTTYNYLETNAAKDTFAASSMGEFAGHTIVARHPYVIARRTGDEGQIKLHTFDGVNYLSGAAQDLSIAYGLVMDTQTTMPDGTTPFSTEAALDATEIGYESAGFS